MEELELKWFSFLWIPLLFNLSPVMGLCMKQAAYHLEGIQLRLNPHFEHTGLCSRSACTLSIKPLQPFYWCLLLFKGVQLWAVTMRER
jgi:hypothetical protein